MADRNPLPRENAERAASRLSLGAMINYSVASLGLGAIGGFNYAALPLFLKSYTSSSVVIGLLTTTRPMAAALVQPIAGRMSDSMRSRWGRRIPILAAGSLVSALALLALGATPPFGVIVILLAILALATSFAGIPYKALMADITPAEQRGTISSFANLAMMIGQVSMVGVGRWLWDVSHMAIFGLLTILLLVSVAYTMWTVREKQGAPSAALRLTWKSFLSEIVAQQEAVKFFVLILLVGLGMGAIFPYITLAAVSMLDIREGQALGVYLAAVLSIGAFSLPVGILGDRIGKQRLLGYCLLIMGMMAMLTSQVRTLPQAYATVGIAGFGMAGLNVLSYPLFTELISEERLGEYTGWAMTLGSVMPPIAALFGGAVIDGLGYRSLFLATGSMFLLSFPILRSMKLRPLHVS